MLKRWREWLKQLTKPFLFLGAPLVITLLFLALWKVPQWQVQAYRARFDSIGASGLDVEKRIQLEKDLITAETNARTALAQILGGLVLLTGLYFTWRNVKVAEEGKLTDRFSKAVELLGSKELDVRLGGIYALERIARDSLKDHWTVMEVLTAFVREHAKLTSPSDTGRTASKIAADIQAILTVIGRRKWVERERPHQRLDLSWANLEGANLEGANLEGANLNGTSFRKANLSGINLSETKLDHATLDEAILVSATLKKASLNEANIYKAQLRNADLYKANFVLANLSTTVLIGAKLIKTNFMWANLQSADLERAVLNDTNFTGASLFCTDFRGAIGLTWEQLQNAKFDDAFLPPELEEQKKVAEAKSTDADQ